MGLGRKPPHRMNLSDYLELLEAARQECERHASAPCFNQMAFNLATFAAWYIEDRLSLLIDRMGGMAGEW